MIEKSAHIAVVYLAWLPYGIDHFHEFINSYQKFPAGCEHTLVVAFNGFTDDNHDLPEKYSALLKERNISNVRLLTYQTGQDILIYKKVAAAIESEYILFVNTFSRFRAANWLKFYVDNFKDGVGLIGASGSNGNYYTGIKATLSAQLKSNRTITQKFREIKYFLKLIFLHKNQFGRFPSPHVRTTGFFTSRQIFLDITGMDIRNKMDAYFFENGKNSMTAQVRKAGYRYILIDKAGNSYHIKDWPSTNIFWNGDQEDLLISDNQSRKYDEATTEEKALLKEIAWGDRDNG